MRAQPWHSLSENNRGACHHSILHEWHYQHGVWKGCCASARVDPMQ